MASNNFIDYVKVCCRSGKGGAGSSHFFRAKGLPNGGPDGGDGGRGGHIILEGDSQLWTLLHLQYQKHIIAGHGQGGAESLRSGAQGEDVILKVPLGTIARDAETGEKKVEITEHGQRIILTPGGRGGLGNDHFKSATNQAPTYAQPGEPERLRHRPHDHRARPPEEWLEEPSLEAAIANPPPGQYTTLHGK